MDDQDRQISRYDAFPYPERDPRQERKRLLIGSPSELRELDHYLFAGKRDWSQPFRVLVAGGGTGDGLIMLAQQLSDALVPHQIVYLDSSRESRDIAAKRAKARGLDNIEFLVADLLSADGMGKFDYIDCCGVLHHLPDPMEGARKLASLLEPNGGLGGMVYAPLGRTGVYPLQSAFSALFGDLPFTRQVKSAKEVLKHLPNTNWIERNPFVGDHKTGDAGLFDLLLHTTDRPFWSDDLIAMLETAGLRLASFIAPIRYDPRHYLPNKPEIRASVDRMEFSAACRLSEELCGSMKTHIFYARGQQSELRPLPTLDEPSAIPHLIGVEPARLADHIAGGGNVKITIDGNVFQKRMQIRSAALIRQIDGRRSIGELLEAANYPALEPSVKDDLTFLIATNQLRCSSITL